MDAMQESMDAARDILRMALLQLDAGDPAEAEKQVDSAIRRWPTYPHAWMAKALLLRRQNKPFAAEAKKAAVFFANERSSGCPDGFAKHFAAECAAPKDCRIEPYVLESLGQDASDLVTKGKYGLDDETMRYVSRFSARGLRVLENSLASAKSTTELLHILKLALDAGLKGANAEVRNRFSAALVQRAVACMVGRSLEFRSWHRNKRDDPGILGLYGSSDNLAWECFGVSCSKPIDSVYHYVNNADWYDEESGRGREKLEAELRSSLAIFQESLVKAEAERAKQRETRLDPFLQNLRELSPGTEAPLVEIFDAVAERQKTALADLTREYEGSVNSALDKLRQAKEKSDTVKVWSIAVILCLIGACVFGIVKLL